MNKIVVFCGSSLGFNPVYKESAIELGNYFVKKNIGLVYGGGKIGMMGVLADTILSQNGDVTGIIPNLLHKEEVIHLGVKNMKVCKTMSERKVMMSKIIDGYITLPGGFGTLDELFEALTLGQLHIEQKPIGLLNVNGFFDPILLQIDKMVEEGYVKDENKKLLIVENSVDKLLEKMDNYKAPKISHIINKVVN